MTLLSDTTQIHENQQCRRNQNLPNIEVNLLLSPRIGPITKFIRFIDSCLNQTNRNTNP